MAYIGTRWNEKMLQAITCPKVFVLLCGRGQQGWVLKHIKDDRFLVFLAIRDFFARSLGSLRIDFQLRVQWILICFLIEVSRESTQTYKWSFSGIFKSLRPFSQVFRQVKECDIHEMITVLQLVACPIVFNLLCHLSRQADVLKPTKNA